MLSLDTNRSDSPESALARGGLRRLVRYAWPGAGAILLAAACFFWWRDVQLIERAHAEAKVVAATVLVKSYSATTPKRYFIRYRFLTPQGRKIYAERMVNSETWGRAFEMGYVKVGYLPSHPEFNWIGQPAVGWGKVLLCGVPGLALLTGWGVRAALKRRRSASPAKRRFRR